MQLPLTRYRDPRTMRLGRFDVEPLATISIRYTAGSMYQVFIKTSGIFSMSLRCSVSRHSTPTTARDHAQGEQASS